MSGGWVSRMASLTVLGEKTPTGRYPRIVARFSWFASRPFEVGIVFLHPRQGPVTWVVSRDLLAAGLDGPAGLGDVMVFPDLLDHRRVELVIASPAGRLGFRLWREFLAGFLAELPTVDCDVTADADAWLARETAS